MSQFERGTPSMRDASADVPAPGNDGGQVRTLATALGTGTPAFEESSRAANDTEVETAGAVPESVLDRLARLERQSRWMKILFGILAAAGIATFSGQFLADGVIVNKTILQSQELKLLDSNGTARLFLRMYSHVPVLQLVDSNGTPRMSLGLRFDDTPFIDLSDRGGRTRATLEMTEEDEPALRLLDTDGETTFQIR